MRLAHSSDDSKIEAWALFEMAAVNLALSNPGLARENLQRSLQLREAEGDPTAHHVQVATLTPAATISGA